LDRINRRDDAGRLYPGVAAPRVPNAYHILSWFYTAVPLLAVIGTALECRRRRTRNPWRGLVITALTGVAVGLATAIAYALAAHARIPPSQVLTAGWWGAAVACLLRGLDLASSWGIARLLRRWIRPSTGQPCCPAAEAFANIARAGLLLLIGVPYVLSILLVYRPHLVRPGNPRSILDAPYELVRFPALDGTTLAGWWIPTTRTARTDHRNPALAWGERTVILCHGFTGDKTTDLRLARDLVPNGYNVLAFDFRAHGQSAGQITTFGQLERYDVLGAVRWIRENHHDESRKIFGLGESLGAAALIAAAADPSPEAQMIDAIAVYAPYDRLGSLITSIAADHDAPAAGWIAVHLALPFAGLQVGSDLAAFNPAKRVQSLWPRPILVIASDADASTDIRRSRAVFDNALQPKFRLWLEKDSRTTMLFGDDDTSLVVRIFFETERSLL
jgi:pimeloyl-ACP methyl ester carboxylesterase